MTVLKEDITLKVEMIVDCFTFYNELDLLELRLEELDEHVDKFVIVEATTTHSGKDKDLYYAKNAHRYRKWKDKIIHTATNIPHNPKNLWEGENKQRETISLILRDLPINENAKIMISDVDEIPDMSMITEDCWDKVTGCIQYHYEYNINHLNGREWIGTVLCRNYHIESYGVQYFRDARWDLDNKITSGWHFSSFGDAEMVYNKHINYAHANDDKHKGQTIKDFERYIEEGIHADGEQKHKIIYEWTEGMLHISLMRRNL